jgi:hypothetical protein
MSRRPIARPSPVRERGSLFYSPGGTSSRLCVCLFYEKKRPSLHFEVYLPDVFADEARKKYVQSPDKKIGMTVGVQPGTLLPANFS